MPQIFSCSSRAHMLETLKAYKPSYNDANKDDTAVGVDFFNIVVVDGRGKMGHYFIAHGNQGSGFQEQDEIEFRAGDKRVATATLVEVVEGPHGVDKGNRFFYLDNVRVE